MKPELQRLQEWHRRIDLTDLSDEVKEQAKAGLTREFGKEPELPHSSRNLYSLMDNDFGCLFSWTATKQEDFWDTVTIALEKQELDFIDPIRVLIAAAKAYPELADLARLAEESL